MKNWIVALAIVAVLGMSGMAGAGEGKGKSKHAGLHGKIQSVDGKTFTIMAGGHKNGHSVKVTLAEGATIMIDGAAGKLDASMVGKVATVSGTEAAGAVTTSSVTISTKHHSKKKPAA